MHLTSRELENTFEDLAARRTTGEIQAQELPLTGFYIAVSEQGDFLCLIHSTDLSPAPSRRLRYLSVDYGLRLRAEFDHGVVSGTYTVIRLSHRNNDLLRTFCTLLEFLLKALGDSPSSDASEEFVEAFIELFAARKGDPRERLKGLFGELAVIRYSPSLERFASGWHDNTNSNKDFSLEASFIEVKTTEGQERKHRISSRQIETVGLQKPVFLASVCIEEDPRGSTVFDILAEIQARIPSEEQTKLVNTVFKTIGLDVEDASELKWSVPRGGESILLFEADHLPRPTIETLGSIGGAISAISFDLNLDVALSQNLEYVPLPEFSTY